MATFITNAEGNYFWQRTRRTVFDWLTCTGVGDIDFPEGELTPQYCPDPLSSGKFKIEGFITGDAGAGTYTLTKPLAKVYNGLLQQKCEWTGRINWVCRGTRSDPRNFELACLMIGSRPNRRGLLNPVRGADDSEARVNTNADLNFYHWAMIYPLVLERQSVSNTANGNFIHFLPELCEDRCSDARGLCENGMIGLDRSGAYLYDSEVKITTDGDTWAATAVDPFTWGGNIESGLSIETVNGIRRIVFRGEAVAAAPPEAAYSDDDGATWTNVTIGTAVNIGVNAAKLSGAHIFVCLDDGYIWRSANQGVSWTVVENAVETTEDLNDLAFYEDYGYCIGANGVFLRSLDGGITWNTVTPTGAPGAGTNYLALEVTDMGHLFIGTNDGRLFRSADQGVTWTEWVNHGGGSIDWIGRDDYLTNGYVLAYIYNSATPVGSLYRSDDGGASWWPVSGMPTNAGLNGGYMCDPNNIFVVGDAQGGTTFIAKATAT
jgi:hypothetical protein